MDREVIEQKLELLRRCLQRVADKCPPEAEALGHDPDLQDIIALNLYKATDWAVVHTIARHHLGDFTEFAKVVADRL